MVQEGEMSGGRGGGAGDAAHSGKQFVCCARRGCGKDGKKRCGGCKQVSTDCTAPHTSCEIRVQEAMPLAQLAQLTLSCTPTPAPPFCASAGVLLLCRVPEGALERGWPQTGVQRSS